MVKVSARALVAKWIKKGQMLINVELKQYLKSEKYARHTANRESV